LTPPSKTENTQSAPHNIDPDVTTPVLPSTQPTNELPSPARPQRATQLPSRYTNFVPSSDIVNQLLAIDNDELTIPLPDGPNSAANIVSHIMAADLILDEANNINADNDNPPTVRHAQRSKYWNEWLAAMHEELEALKAKGVYEEVDQIPPGRKPVQCKWVLCIKRDQNGQISHFKGQLVAKGFTQIFGQDFTFNKLRKIMKIFDKMDKSKNQGVT
jgi:hypothetical protein